MVAERDPGPSPRTASDLELNFAKFCASGRPLTIFAAIFLGDALLAFVVGDAELHAGRPSRIESFVKSLNHYAEELWFITPTLLAAYFGRRYLKSVLLGKLSMFGMLRMGVLVGCACVLFSNYIGLDYFRSPTLHLQGFWDAFGATPLVAYLLGPLGEEMIYQGGLQTWLQRFGPVAAILGATAPFWGSHLYGGFVPMHHALIFLLPSTLAFALVRQTTKSLGAAIIAHSTYNVLVSSLQVVPR